MARTTTQLRDVVLAEGDFDSTLWSTAAVQWLSERHRTMIVESKWKFADSYSFGTTTANVSTYTWPAAAVQVEWLEINGVRYYYATEEQVDGLYEGTFFVDDSFGRYTTAADATGATKQFKVWPLPATSSLPITGQVALDPADLDTSGSNPLIPDDLEPALIAGAIATGEKRVKKRPDVAQPFEDEFQAGIVTLTKRRRMQGVRGARSVPVKGFHF